MWFDEAVVYQIYPLGLVRAPPGKMTERRPIAF